MSKKINSRRSPRKFIDKIALIKQKEAVSNACFESAIQSLSEINMKQVTDLKDGIGTDEVSSCTMDNYSTFSGTEFNSKPCSPLSFVSTNSSNLSHDSQLVNDGTTKYQRNVFANYFPDRDKESGFHTDQFIDTVRYRPHDDRLKVQTFAFRHSDVEPYFPFNQNGLVNEQTFAGSLPNVNSCDNHHYGYEEHPQFENNQKSPQKIQDTLNLQEALSTLQQFKSSSSSSKKALLEHLKNKGLQSVVGHSHPHHVTMVTAGDEPPPFATTADISLSSPSFPRKKNHIHEYEDSVCVTHTGDKGVLKHYSVNSSPYLSLVGREQYHPTDHFESGRQRHFSSFTSKNVNNNLTFQVTGPNETSVNMKNKSLTPTGNPTDYWFSENSNNLLSPVMSNIIVNENWRRVASDSSLQNTLKQQDNRISFTNNLNVNFNQNINRVCALKNESSMYPGDRNQTMTAYPAGCSNDINNPVPIVDYQRQQCLPLLSTSSSFIDNILGVNSPDENVDPSIFSNNGDHMMSPDPSQQAFKLNALNKSLVVDNNTASIKSEPLVQDEEMPDSPFTAQLSSSSDGLSVTKVERSDCHVLTAQTSDPNHQCWWANHKIFGKSNNEFEETQIKACEKLDPKDIIVDPNVNFDCISDFNVNEVDTTRRDSLSWTVDFLSNLNSESGTNNAHQHLKEGPGKITEEEIF